MASSSIKPQTVPTGIESPTALATILGISRQRAHQLLHKDQHRARSTVTKALKRGRITKPLVCERCGGNDLSLEAHHPDYSQRLLVNWLCITCHSVVHPHPHRATSKPICRRCGNDVDRGTSGAWKTLCGDCTFYRHSLVIMRPCGWCSTLVHRPLSQVRANKHGFIFCDRHCRSRWNGRLQMERALAKKEKP